jgi:hypothetical protein
MPKFGIAILLCIGLLGCGKSGPPEPNSRWGPCYNSAYVNNHPTHSRVGDPIFILAGEVYIRSEVLVCKDEFVRWVYSEHEDLLSQESAKIISCYIATNGSESCLGR